MNIINTCKHSLLLVIICISLIASGQDFSNLGDNKCYVVVGAFKLEKNAAAFANMLTPKGYDAQYKYNSRRHLYYVYTFETNDRELAKGELFSIRNKHPEMTDSWLYAGNFKGGHITSEEWTAILGKSTAEETESIEDLVKKIAENTEEEEEPEEQVEEAPILAEEPGTFKIYLNTTNGQTQREISGNFKVIDMERNKQLSPVKTQELIRVRPKNGTNRVKFVSDIFGYKIEEYTLDLDEPLATADPRVQLTGDTILIDFELAKYEKGEKAILWKVYFFKDAAIMKQESIYELNQLLRMMEEDEKLKIKIHGHTNGNSKGKVLHLDLDDKKFFSLNGAHNEDIASAKKLSEYRAFTIQRWLIDQGIAEDRMETEGWGGKHMIYDKHDNLAYLNVRVEIEVLETS